jgi:hypothetical protein
MAMSDRYQRVALERITELASEIRELETRLAREVARAGFHNATWSQIGSALGVTSQSAHRRFRYQTYDAATGTSWFAPPLPLS